MAVKYYLVESVDGIDLGRIAPTSGDLQGRFVNWPSTKRAIIKASSLVDFGTYEAVEISEQEAEAL